MRELCIAALLGFLELLFELSEVFFGQTMVIFEGIEHGMRSL